MTALRKGLVIAAVQVLLVVGVGAKFLLDRTHYPRVWVQTAPFDPDLPIRGRYVRLAALVEHEVQDRDRTHGQARLEVRDGKLVAIADAAGHHWLARRTCDQQPCWVLSQPLAYFIPEHIADPSVRKPGEQLWVEVTLPPEGPPRPIRLGVKIDGELTPLDVYDSQPNPS